ncbi:calcium-binding protein [Streptosporangium sp. OZ121]|uniref:calcium-binding protein n=1 Tax=Streptosporangium sp. OZ121 TaxID=3444183 RepID=UPI003F7AD720
MRKILSVLALAAAVGGLQAALAVPASADTRASVTGGNLIVSAVAGGGRANDVTLTSANGDIVLTDLGDAVVPGTGCVRQSANAVRCSGVTVIQLNLGDGDDSVTNTTALNTLVRGGGGNDTFDGGTGRDRFVGGGGNDTFRGNGGDDSMDAAGTADGNDTFLGGTGIDTVLYSGRTSAVTVALNGVAVKTGATNSDETQEVDTNGADVENATGGAGGDKITGNQLVNDLRGNGGDDTLNAGAGADLLNGGPGADVLNGGSGDDTLQAVDRVGGNDTVNGGKSTDRCDIDNGDTETFCEN